MKIFVFECFYNIQRVYHHHHNNITVCTQTFVSHCFQYATEKTIEWISRILF